MSAIKYLSCIIFLFTTISLFPQDQSILIFDPNDVSTSFQSTLAQLTDDSVFVTDTLDDTIFNYDALFLFINYPYELSQTEGNKLISYTSDNKPAYLFCGIFPTGIDTIVFWNHIGIDEMLGLLISVPIDTVFGLAGEFTEGVVFDTSFMSGLIPIIYGNVDSVLIGDADSWEVNTTYKSGYDSLNVIIDLYNLIDDYGFLQSVLIHFGLIIPPPITVLSPNGYEFWLVGSTQEITWASNSVDSVRIDLSTDDGINWYNIVESTISDGNFKWVVEVFQTSHLCRIRISDVADSTSFDINDEPFTIDIFPSVDDSLSIYLPGEYKLFQNYPNPFNPSTKIKYEIPDQVRNDSRLVTLKVYDVLGNEIATLVNEEKQPGIYEVEFSAISHSGFSGIRALPSGIYFYQLKAGNFVETKKMILMK